MLPFFREIPFPDQPTPDFRYYFQNENYSYGDASVLYAILRMSRPKHLIEIGSGFSSACSLDTIDKFLDGQVEVTLIEPYPELLRSVLDETSLRRVDLIERHIQDVPLSVFGRLAEGDLLFVDSTHVLKTDSDVCRILFDILPALEPGVLVHFHDIFWPLEYPEQWVLEYNRSWNEAYALRAFLMFNSEFKIEFFNDFFRQLQHKLVADTYPKFLKNTGGALWLRKRRLEAGELKRTAGGDATYDDSVVSAEMYADRGSVTAEQRVDVGVWSRRQSMDTLVGIPAGALSSATSTQIISPETVRAMALPRANFDGVMQGIAEFEARLSAAKSGAPASFRWYPYNTIANFEHIDSLITAEHDFLFDPPKRYADFGCADGDLAYYLEARGHTLDLYDYGPTNMNHLDGARYLQRVLGSTARIVENDFDSQFKVSQQYDLIFFLGLLYHLKNPFYALEHLSHVSRYMLLSTRIARQFSRDGDDVSKVAAAYLLDPDEANNDTTNYWIFTEAGLKRLTRRTGWGIIAFRTVGDTIHSNPQDLDRDERAFALLKSRR